MKCIYFSGDNRNSWPGSVHDLSRMGGRGHAQCFGRHVVAFFRPREKQRGVGVEISQIENVVEIYS